MEPQTVVPWLYNGLNLVATLVVAPITEELLFRGFILQRWAVKWNLPLALILSSVLFGLMHPNPVGLTVFGLLMGVLYIKTRSLLVAIACHALNNGLAVILEMLPKIDQAELITLAQLQSGLGASVLMVAISAPFLFRFITKNFPRRDAPIPYLVNQFQA
jgi:hypothetical protein